jgi:Carboxypeptidase regulatory-like domain
MGDMTYTLRVLVSLAAAGLLFGADDNSALPVKRVVLYKNGVGYFEHVGRVQGNQQVTIPFTSGQLNDVLKSLTVLDMNGGRITGVEYGSAAPVDRQIGDLRLPLGDKTSLTDYLGALRGAKLEVRSGTSVITGRLLSVERKTRMGGGTTLEVDYVSLVTDNGELRTTEVAPQFSVKLLDRGLAGKMERFLDIVSAGREADVRRMTISTEGTGERSLFLSYISEVPVWKATYRIVLDSKRHGDPLLQGWAIVDNVVGQDWQNVELSLVAGAPQSFVQQLSEPYYSRRPVVGLPESINLSPQTHQATLISGRTMLAGKITDSTGAGIAGAAVQAYDASGSMMAQTTADASGVYGFETLPEGAVRLQADARGFQRASVVGVHVVPGRTAQQDIRMDVGSVSQAIEVTAASPELQTSNSSVSTSGRMLGSGAGMGGRGYSKMAPPPPPPPAPARPAYSPANYRDTVAQELGDLFEYKLKDPISILKNHSALVPILQSSITADKVSLWNEQSGMPRPERALWLTNSTGLTLDGGSFSVMEEDTFSGEGLFEPIRPGEKRLVTYASDLAVNVGSKTGTEQQRVTRVMVSRGLITLMQEMRERKTYTVRNEDTSGRTVIIEHPVRIGYDLRGDVKPAEITSDWMRFRVQVPSKQTVALVVEEGRPVLNTVQITNVTKDQIDLFVRQQSIDKTIEEALRTVLAQKDVVAGLDDRHSILEDESQTIFDDQQRLRENMKALKGSAEEKALLQRYTRQLDEQENRLETLRKEMAQVDVKKEAAQGELNRMIQALAFDVRL